MNKKVVNYVVILLMMFFGVLSNVSASITLDYEANPDNKEILAGTNYDSTFESLFQQNSEGNRPRTHYRISTTGKNVFCADARLGSPSATGSITFSDCKNYTSYNKALTYILENSFPSKSLGQNKFESYFITQMAIWYHTNNDHVWMKPYNDGTWKNGGTVVKKIGNLIEESKKAINSTPSLKATVTSNNMKLTSDKRYYVSNAITLNGTYLNSKISVSTNNSSAFVTSSETATSGSTTFDNGSKVYVKIPVSSVSESLNIKLTISGTSYLGNGKFTLCDFENPSVELQGLLEYTPSTTNLKDEITLTIEKDKSTIAISKQSATGNRELPGATLKITDSENKSISCTIQRFENGSTTKNDLTECIWTSGNAPAVIIGLAEGKYYLEETIAPDGYVLDTEKIEFEIKDGEQSKPIIMKNNINKLIISKISADKKETLSGASLQIEDEEGKIVKYCVNEKGIKNTECKWISTDKPYEIEGMPNGTYYLVETQAPEGYVLNTEKKKITIDGKTKIINVEMTNELKVEVPDTLSTKSALLLVIAMFDIALGIGIITYVKRNKVTE